MSIYSFWNTGINGCYHLLQTVKSGSLQSGVLNLWTTEDCEMKKREIAIETSTNRLEFNLSTGRLVSFRTTMAPEQEFIVSSDDHPVFVIQYLDKRRQYQQLTSLQAASASSRMLKEAGRTVLTVQFRKIGGMDLDVTTRVSVSAVEPLSRWRISVRNGAGIEITDVQYPFVVCAYKLGGEAGSERLVMPDYYGQLMPKPSMEKVGPDCPAAWQLSSGCSFYHYPGAQFAQFLAFYNDRAGLYFACEDVEGNVKRFRALHREPGMRLGVAHVGDWPTRGERTLEYDTVLGSFSGDWYDAAAMYRGWSLKQKWATPLHRRTDIPRWLLESPPYITIRPQGILDAGPVFPIKEFLPYEKCIPLLDKVARKVRSPLVAVIMGWERGGSWVYPDCFPPIGGEASVKRFTRLARGRGWHVGSFCNGTRWAISHSWNGYDGRKYYEDRNGAEGVCRLPDGREWLDDWGWRSTYLSCMGTKATRRIATNFVKRLLDWGLESIQFFDQNCGAATFPCYARNHEHPPAPGKWMARKMEELIDVFNKAARDAGETEAINSVEMCCNEYCLQLFQESDSRLMPPGHNSWWGRIPLYQFLFHECIVIHGGMGHAPEPYHLEIRNAYNGVMGEIAGGVLTGDGTLLAKDTENWANWEPKVGNNDNALDMIRAVTALRRGPGRDFLVHGRMQKPCKVERVKKVTWDHGGRKHAIDAVFHGCWTAPDGRFAVALANWTTDIQGCTVIESRLGSRATIRKVGRTIGAAKRRIAGGRLTVEVPPLGCVLVEGLRT